MVVWEVSSRQKGEAKLPGLEFLSYWSLCPLSSEAFPVTPALGSPPHIPSLLTPESKLLRRVDR